MKNINNHFFFKLPSKFPVITYRSPIRSRASFHSIRLATQVVREFLKLAGEEELARE